METTETTTSFVLVHGAFADGSSWRGVISALSESGNRVVAVQNALTSLGDDAAATRRAIAQVPGRIILVGHSWGGAVITEVGGDERIDGLVYVSAFPPDAGQSVDDLLGFKLSQSFPGTDNTDGFYTLSGETLNNKFAQDLPQKERDLLFATQGPIASRCFAHKVTAAGWRKKRSMYILCTKDRMIEPQVGQRFFEQLEKSTTPTSKKELACSHVAMLSKPDELAKQLLNFGVGSTTP